MSEQENVVAPSPNEVKSGGKGSAPDPILTSEMRERSDKRIASMAKNLVDSAPRVQKIAGVNVRELPNTTQLQQTKEGKEVEVKPTNGQPQEVKPKEQSEKSQEVESKGKSQEETTKPEKVVTKKLSYDELESERVKWQSRASTSENKVKEFETKVAELEKTATTSQKYKDLVEEFQKDPVTFINSKFPELNQMLNADPVKAIEIEVSQFQNKLLTEYKKQYGEDWRYSEAEALTVGSPSWRFRLALDSRTDEIRRRQVGFLDNRRKSAEEQEKRTLADKGKLKQEFGFTDDDLKRAEQALEKEGISYYNMVRLALIDDVIRLKLSVIVPPTIAPKDLASDTRGSGVGQGVTSEEENKLSKKGMTVLSRLPIRR